MNIDTTHSPTHTRVEITCTTARERNLSDDSWKRVAFNQHRLLWKDDSSGSAVLPRKITGVAPSDSAQIKRDGDHISVTFPIDE